jgi:hypothetical protein
MNHLDNARKSQRAEHFQNFMSAVIVRTVDVVLVPFRYSNDK